MSYVQKYLKYKKKYISLKYKKQHLPIQVARYL